MHKPRLSVIVIAYNMAREIPRTLLSLSPAMQTGIAEDDYEVILIDNGSTRPFDEAQVRQILPGVRLHHMKAPGPSPVKAINTGLSMAQGDVVGVFIDGARMASPGLLSQTLKASRLHENPVIGTLAFHLGPEVQMSSIHKGYNQAVEDSLLQQVDWEKDGYRLFDISVFAGSSAKGWFTIPAETNALFMRRQHWQDLGGYDEQFITPGGGLANLDVWKRACEAPNGEVIMLLGEATFHQVHGGIATNAPSSPFAIFDTEYREIRGKAYVPPVVKAQYFGRIHSPILPSLRQSLEMVAADVP